jgi:DNA-binding transcriptional ArsR family regulator
MAWNDTLEFRKIDQRVIKSLSSDTRVEMLKKLSDRRKMPTELAKEMNLAASTIVEHLKELEGAGLVKRQETQHKWIYYELTSKGSDIFKPKIPFQFILMLAFGIMITGLSMFNYFSLPMPAAYNAEKTMMGESIVAPQAADQAIVAAESATGGDLTLEISLIISAMGVLLIAYSAYLILSKRPKF